MLVMEYSEASKALTLLEKLKGFSTRNSTEIIAIIDVLNSTDPSVILGEKKELENLITQLLQLVPPESSNTLSKLSILLTRLLNQLKFNGNLIDEGFVLNILDDTSINISTKYNAIYCILDLLNNEKFPKKSLEICCLKCLALLKWTLQCCSEYDNVLEVKILKTTLKCLQCIFSFKNIKWRNIGEILGIIKSLLFFGLPGQTNVTDTNIFPTLRCPEVVAQYESQSESDTTYPKVRKNKKNKRRERKTPQKKVNSKTDEVDNVANDSFDGAFPSPTSKYLQNIQLKASSSDSELSDAENSISRLKRLRVSVRQNAYLTLQVVIQMLDKKVMFGYWSSFLPEHPIMPGLKSSPNIFTSILKDPSSQVRLNALALLSEMLNCSKQFLIHADGRNHRQMSFTSLSSILATMISEIHRCLLLALLSENSSVIITQILKNYAILCENVPYFKLNKDILFKFLKPVKNFLSFKEPQVQVAALAVFGTLINSDLTPPEVEILMLSPNFDDALASNLHPTPDTSVLKPWIAVVCKSNVLGDEAKPIKIQSLQLLSSFVGKYFLKSESFLADVSDIIFKCLSDSDASMQLHAAKLLDILGRCASNLTDIEIKKKLDPIVCDTWQSVLSGPLLRCLSSEENKTLQSVCCDALSSLPLQEFENLSRKQQISCITVLLGLAADVNPNVRGASIRCLGLYCLFPPLSQDPSFVQDVSKILIDSVKDPNVMVRFKASWSIGNLSDAVFASRNPDLQPEQISHQLYFSLGKACIEFSKDGDRVKANAVRALGNFLKYLPQQFVDIQLIQEFIIESCDTLRSTLKASLMKVCWNSCYALGNMLKNRCLMDKGIISVDDLLKSLFQALKSPNFKVRISAAQAISSMTSRTNYGKCYVDAWQHLVSAFMSTADDVNFKEIKHQENLNDQLCLSLVQLSAFMMLEDIPLISSTTIEASGLLLTSMWKFGSRTTDDKNLNVCTAIEKLRSIGKETDISEMNPFLTLMEDILNQAVVAFYGQNEVELCKTFDSALFSNVLPSN